MMPSDMMPASRRLSPGPDVSRPMELIRQAIASAQSAQRGARKRMEGDPHNQAAKCDLEAAQRDEQEWTGKLRQAERGIFE